MRPCLKSVLRAPCASGSPCDAKSTFGTVRPVSERRCHVQYKTFPGVAAAKPHQRTTDSPKMKIIDEMLNLDLLTREQHLQISAWIARSSSPEEILQMPAPLWQAVERASQTMGINEDLLRPPSLDAGDVVFS